MSRQECERPACHQPAVVLIEDTDERPLNSHVAVSLGSEFVCASHAPVDVEAHS